MNIEHMKILSIDDNPTNLFIIENYAKSLDLDIESYVDSQEAVEAMKKRSYDLLIVDYMMPNIDGLEFIKAFRKYHKDVPIVMLTAVGSDVELQVKALELGANDFLDKSVNAEIIKAKIVNMLKLRKSQIDAEDRALLYLIKSHKELFNIQQK